eukprot:14400584-Alexandrium_andersonii.AAC.1
MQLPLGLWYGGMFGCGCYSAGPLASQARCGCSSACRRALVGVCTPLLCGVLWFCVRRFGCVARAAPICHCARALLRRTIGY